MSVSGEVSAAAFELDEPIVILESSGSPCKVKGMAWLYRVVSSSSQCLGTSAKPVFRNFRLYKSMVYKREKSEELGIAVVPLSYFVHIACYAALTRNASQLCLLTKTVEISTLAVLKVHFFSSLLRMLFACHTLIGAVETMPVKY